MFLQKSRYKNARPFEFKRQEPAGQPGVFRGVRARDVFTLDGMVEHIVTDTDRIDLLAQHYYGDDRLWWRIIDANPQLLFADQLIGKDYLGKAILIPQAKN